MPHYVVIRSVPIRSTKIVVAETESDAEVKARRSKGGWRAVGRGNEADAVYTVEVLPQGGGKP